MADLLDEARGHIDDYCGEGVIAFPELTESVSRSGDVSEGAAAIAAQTALTSHFASGKIQVFLGRVSSFDTAEVTGAEAEAVLSDISHFAYGDGDEVRAWFSLEC